MGTPLETGQAPSSEHKSPREILARLEARGVAGLTFAQQQSIQSGFSKELDLALGRIPRTLRRVHLLGLNEHFSTSLSMYPSRIAQRELSQADEGKRVLVTEMGGTNVYAAIVTIMRNSQTNRFYPKVTHAEKQKLSGTHFESAEDFFNEVSEPALRALSHIDGEIDGMGDVWSFPGKSEKTAHGVDQIAAKELPKEFIIMQISERPVGEQLLAALKRNGGSVPDTSSIAVLNDTVGVLLAGGGKVGGVIGTGFNFAIQIGGQIYNIEAGGFSKVPQTDLSKAIDAASDNKGAYLAEKQIAGRYLGQQLQTVAGWLHEENEFPLPASQLHTEDVSNLLSEDPKKMHETLSLFGSVTEAQQQVLIGAARRLRDRSAQVAGTLLATLIQKYPQEFSADEIVVPIEGSVFGQMPGYQEEVARTVRDNLGPTFRKPVRFVLVEQGGTKGAAIAALTVNK